MPRDNAARQRAGYLTGLVSAHPVGQDKQSKRWNRVIALLLTQKDEDPILIMASHLTYIGNPSCRKNSRFEVMPGRRGMLKSIQIRIHAVRLQSNSRLRFHRHGHCRRRFPGEFREEL